MHLWKTKKRRIAESAAKENAIFYAVTLETLEQKRTEAQALPDVGARYLALNVVEAKIQDCFTVISTQISDQKVKLPKPFDPEVASGKVALGGVGTTLTSIMLLSTPVVAAIPPLVPLMAVSGIAIALLFGIGAIKTGNKPQQPKRILKLIGEGLQDFQFALAVLAKRIMNEKVELAREFGRLLRSPSFAEVCQHEPELKSAFEGAMKCMAEGALLDNFRQKFANTRDIPDVGARYLALESLKKETLAKDLTKVSVEINFEDNAYTSYVAGAMRTLMSPLDRHLWADSYEKGARSLRSDIETEQKNLLSDLNALAASPCFDELYKCIPELEAFTVAAAKESFAEQKNSVKFMKPSFKK